MPTIAGYISRSAFRTYFVPLLHYTLDSLASCVFITRAGNFFRRLIPVIPIMSVVLMSFDLDTLEETGVTG